MEELTWSRRLNGWQAVKFGSLRKDLKKLGQLSLVKLLPRLVSKGSGRGELEGASAVVIGDVEVPVVDAEGPMVVAPLGVDDEDSVVVAPVGVLVANEVLDEFESSV